MQGGGGSWQHGGATAGRRTFLNQKHLKQFATPKSWRTKLVWFSGCWNTHSGAVYGLLILKKQPCDAYLGGGAEITLTEFPLTGFWRSTTGGPTDRIAAGRLFSPTTT